MRTAAVVALGPLLALLAACEEAAPPTSAPGPAHSAVSPEATILRPGDNLQARVNSAPAGTAFTLKPGVYRLQSVRPKNGMSFTGEPGTILSGARLLTSFTRQGSYWVASGQTQQGRRYPGRPNGKPICQPEHPRCSYPEDLFLDNVRLRHVSSLSAVGRGRWYFDYEADKIYFADNPAGRKVEATVTSRAFAGLADNVTIRKLIIEKYATPLQDAVVRADSGTGWLIEDNQVRHIHGIGIFTGNRTTVRRNYVHRNLQLGIAGIGTGALIEHNEVAYINNPQVLAYGWAAGATKWHHTKNLVLRRNFVHHNKGPGLWTDIDNIYTLIEYNRVEDNGRNGIFHEISYDAVIRFNTAARNGWDMADTVRGGGIAVTSSPNVEIYGNTLVGNHAGFAINQDTRGTGRYGFHEVRNLFVHDNTVTLAPGTYTGLGGTAATEPYFTTKHNRFVHNTYHLSGNVRPFFWRHQLVTARQWKAQGQDVTGTFNP